MHSLAHVVGPTFFQGLAVSFMMFSRIPMPYSAFMCLSEVLGEGELFRLFFVAATTCPNGQLASSQDSSTRTRVAERVRPACVPGSYRRQLAEAWSRNACACD